mmetsp:Transcript_3430/g.12767  ORF Transcript_3430/g.12767 Transcript_3430/m.12767 type:complete len:244 (+) Transcript_3430:212-943(+)
MAHHQGLGRVLFVVVGRETILLQDPDHRAAVEESTSVDAIQGQAHAGTLGFHQLDLKAFRRLDDEVKGYQILVLESRHDIPILGFAIDFHQDVAHVDTLAMRSLLVVLFQEALARRRDGHPPGVRARQSDAKGALGIHNCLRALTGCRRRRGRGLGTTHRPGQGELDRLRARTRHHRRICKEQVSLLVWTSILIPDIALLEGSLLDLFEFRVFFVRSTTAAVEHGCGPLYRLGHYVQSMCSMA